MLEWLKETLGEHYNEAVDRRVSEELEQEVAKQRQVAGGWEQRFLTLQQEVEQNKRDQVAEGAIEGLQFSSQSAKQAFLRELGERGLAIKEGKLQGFEEFLKDYQQKDAAAFCSSQGVPRVVGSAAGKLPATEGPNAQANSALRAVFGKG